MKFKSSKYLFLTILIFSSVTNVSFATDVSGIYSRMPLLDWNRYYFKLLKMCKNKHPDSISALRDRISKWHTKNDATIKEIVKIYKNYPETLGRESLQSNRNKINKLFFDKMNSNSLKDYQIKDYCFKTPFNRDEYSRLLGQLKSKYGE